MKYGINFLKTTDQVWIEAEEAEEVVADQVTYRIWNQISRNVLINVNAQFQNIYFGIDATWLYGQ